MQTIGTCSLCGGEVQAPYAWSSVVPYVPTCSRCGATMAQHGPVIPMVPASVPSVFSSPVHPEPPWRVHYEPTTAGGLACITITLPPEVRGGSCSCGPGEACSRCPERVS